MCKTLLQNGRLIIIRCREEPKRCSYCGAPQ